MDMSRTNSWGTLCGRNVHVKPSETVVSGLNESQRNPKPMADKQRRLERKKRKLEKRGNGLKNNDMVITDQKKITKKAASLEEKEAEGGETKNQDWVYPAENSLSNSELSVGVRQQAWVCSHEAPRAENLHIDQILSTGEDSQPNSGMARSKRKRPRRRERKKEQERYALKDKNIDFHTTHAEVATSCDTIKVSEVGGLKLRSIHKNFAVSDVEENSAVSDIRKSSLSFSNDVQGQQQDIDSKANATLSERENPKTKKKKKKRHKPREVSDPLGNNLEVTEENRLVTGSGKRVRGNNDNFGQGLARSEMSDRQKNSASVDEVDVEKLAITNLEKRKSEKETHANHDVPGTLGVSHISEKKKKNRNKKKKSHVDHNIENMENKKEIEIKIVAKTIDGMAGMSLVEDVTVSQKDEEREVDKVGIGSLTPYVFARDSLAREVVLEETGKQLPRCTCHGHIRKKLLVLDLNGILVDVVHGHIPKFHPHPDGKVSGRSGGPSLIVFSSSALKDSMWRYGPRDACIILEPISRLKWLLLFGLSSMIQMVMKRFENRLRFWLDRKKCTKTKFSTLENDEKPLVMKDLRKVWDRFGSCRYCRKLKYDETNTLLVDDSPYKALCNPPHTGVFPYPYKYTDRGDCALGPNGDLRLYLERLADAENVPKFVEENPFGQPSISESHPSWEFYSKVLQSHIAKSAGVPMLPDSSRNVSNDTTTPK